MANKVDALDDNLDVEEGPLEETIDSPRFYNLTVEETQDIQLSSLNDRSRIVFSPGTRSKLFYARLEVVMICYM